MARNYKYKIFPVRSVRHFLETGHEDAYFAEELNSFNKSDWDKALAEGYRWVRTDGEFVVLELETIDE